MILVTGATGTVGREVVAALVAASRPVRALTRYPSRALFDPRVDVVEGDLSKPETLAHVMEGVDGIFSVALGHELAEQEAALARAARQAGAGRIVKLSVLGAGEKMLDDPGVAGWHSRGERAIRDSGVPWTFVRPGAFMSNASYWARSVRAQGRVFSNFGDGRVAYIHPRDVAAVAVCALTASGHEGKVHSLTGPDALGVADQVATLAKATGRPIEYVKVSDEEARGHMERSGMPAYLIAALLPFAPVVRAGKADGVLDTVEQVTGRKALGFVEWAEEHAAEFL